VSYYRYHHAPHTGLYVPITDTIRALFVMVLLQIPYGPITDTHGPITDTVK
jgi:hypothetical protein